MKKPLLLYDNNQPHQQAITNGATHIIKTWPDTFRLCWLSTFICILLCTFILSAIFTITGPPSHEAIADEPQILRTCSDAIDNNLSRTISDHPHQGVVVIPHVYVFYDEPEPWTINELFNLYKIQQYMRNYTIHVTGMYSEDKYVERHRNRSAKYLEMVRIMGSGEFVRIVGTNRSYEQFLSNSPIPAAKWRRFGTTLKLFAVRVINMWQQGGVDVDIRKRLDKILKTFLLVDRKPSSVDYPQFDKNGVHFACNVRCHAFFEQIIRILRNCTGTETIQSILLASPAIA